MSDAGETVAPGWDAIDATLDRLYEGREPKHYGTIVKLRAGGPDPLDGVSVYKRTDGICHWHYVSYGLTELYTKESPDPDESGYGFELTFRLACRATDEDPPIWAINLMQNLARYVFKTGNCFAAGHHMSLNGRIATDEETDLGAVVFAADPELPVTQSAHGPFKFLQLVGITEDELDAMKQWNSARFTELLAATNPQLVTDLARKSVLRDPATAQTIAERTAQEGSSLEQLYVSTAIWSRTDGATRLTIDALATSGMGRQLRGRLLHQRPLLIVGAGGAPEHVVSFTPAETSSVTVDETGGHLRIALAPAQAAEIADGLHPQRGTYRWATLPGFEIEVLPTEIKDRDGNVLRVVG